MLGVFSLRFYYANVPIEVFIALTSFVTTNSWAGMTVPWYNEGATSSVWGGGEGWFTGLVTLPARPLGARFVTFVAGGWKAIKTIQGCQFDWLINRIIDWLEWLTWWWNDRSIDFVIDWFNWMSYLRITHLIEMIDFNNWLINWLIYVFIDLINCMIWLICWLIDWFI